jgi:guanylate kinase
MPASIEELARRLWARKTEEPSVVMRRVRTASQEVASVDMFDYVVFNEEGRLDATMEHILAIVQAERLRVLQPDVTL